VSILLDESVPPLAQVTLAKSDEGSCTGADLREHVSLDDEYLAMVLWRIKWKGDGRSGSRRRDAMMLRWHDYYTYLISPSPPCVAYKALLELALNATVATVARHYKY